MILTGPEIAAMVTEQRIVIEPFDPARLNPNSYNFRLGDVLLVYKNPPLDPKRHNEFSEMKIPSPGLVLEPGRLYLGSTIEVLGSREFAPTFSARSSVARLGLFINLSASLGDIGYIGQWTLQLVAVEPLRVYGGMEIGQMMWWQPRGRIELYDGKYQGGRGPQTSKIHIDFEARSRRP